MSGPAAIDKADTLYRYALTQGCELSSFAVAISAAEGLELVDYWGERNYRDDPTYQVDQKLAHKTGDPFPMLSNFVLNGMEIIAKGALH